MLSILPSLGRGSGSSLPLPVLILAGISTAIATFVSATSIFLHLRNYRKPRLQRQVVRIMLMVPIYAIASLISLFSLEAAFFIDAVRDIYEAFVIYCFFDLLLQYLGGERSLLISLHGRPPKYPVFPGNLLWPEVDVSDPYTFLFLKRGILQYVQVKPVLAIVTIILKAVGKYNEGDLRANSGYLYVSIVYNISIFMALYCLAMFWMCVSEDLKPFRPMPKFLCVKGILFFSFWQSIFISILVAAGVIAKLGPYTDSEHISLALTDALVCLEMPFFAFAHQYAFSTVDFVDPNAKYAARMQMWKAFQDAFGLKDVVEDSKTTLRGEGMDYRQFEPSEGFMHQGAGRDRRIRAGLRYSQGGKRKYWLPQPITSTRPPGPMERRVNKVIERVTGRDDQGEEVHAPLLPQQAQHVVHLAPDLQSPSDEDTALYAFSDPTKDGYELPFGEIDEEDEELFSQAKRLLFGDYNYPVVDVSNESARIRLWNEEERILRDERGAYFSPILGPGAKRGYGALGNVPRSRRTSDLSDSERARGKAPQRSATPPVREAIIDKETDRLAIPGPQASDVQLRWTKIGASPARSPRIRTLSSQGRPTPGASSSGGTSSSGSSAASSPHSRPPPSPRKEDAPRVLPPDAVDLVVEDPHAAHEESSHERRRGEPQGLRKVYRRGYVVEDRAGTRRGEVEVEPRPAEASFAIGEDADALLDPEEAVAEMTVTRAETPPAHARIVVDNYDEPQEHNPWA
ncbi:organic solute transporter Ostalpha-domain-containing protein [Phanerochaete sordida]|uniref:Organic solute transporter Ostalpha-domain-containing protein n=1 Tax=Phanerochaete sordida TaxID=48140 RepID=A0A9P3GQV4_9APHY|nr:organic solute transporter Ostalpha-domain-containing protein [Phanerochaete sordida]